jgi:phosphodiesterase/alkaline phosphatase D-like protein
VLGRPQRQWLRAALHASLAPVKLLVSGSVLLGNPTWHPADERANANANGSEGRETATFCSGDDLDCYAAAQVVARGRARSRP